MGQQGIEPHRGRARGRAVAARRAGPREADGAAVPRAAPGCAAPRARAVDVRGDLSGDRRFRKGGRMRGWIWWEIIWKRVCWLVGRLVERDRRRQTGAAGGAMSAEGVTTTTSSPSRGSSGASLACSASAAAVAAAASAASAVISKSTSMPPLPRCSRRRSATRIAVTAMSSAATWPFLRE